MKNKKFLSVLLCLALLASLPVLPGGAAAADDAPGSGMKISKTATANNDGTYTITLEAYATGSQVTTTVQKDIPTDIVLVIDQSGSMAEEIGSVSYEQYKAKESTNSKNYEKRHNGGSANLWHKLDDDSYVSVSVTKKEEVTYGEITKGKNNSSSGNATNLWDNQNNLYAKVNGDYVKVSVNREWNYYYYYYYYLPNGQEIASSGGRDGEPAISGTDDNKLYLASIDDTQTVYTYTYTDSTGALQTIGTSTGADTRFEPAFYRRSTDTSGGGSRLNALKSAANAFANAVAVKAAGADGTIGTNDDVNHRIAVVGFACGDRYNYESYNYENTEVFVGSKQYRYGSDAQGQYGNAFQKMNTSTGVANISASIGALDAYGGTLTNLGLEMANGIFSKNSIPAGEKRNRVVIVFTDGVPGWSGYESNIATSAIAQASTAKNTYGATVYSIGIFSGADATSAGNQNGSETEKANWFMQQVSSNNGTPQRPSYYLSAGDSASLNNIFQQISNQIETGGAETTLGSETVIKDIISPSFVLPNGTTANDIVLETYKCTGKDGDGEYTWSKNADAMGATATITKADIAEEPKKLDQVNVTGFDFSKYWCGTETVDDKVTYRGNKLVIKIKVEPRPGFFGGNGVTTNTSAGVYKNATAEKPTVTFDQPKVNVPLATVVVEAPEANVYLGAHLNETVTEADVLKNGATVKIGDSTLDFSQDNYGLKPWQNEYVNIEASASTSGSFANMTEDAGYTVAVKVTPKTPEGAEGKEASATGTIHVFKPELTFRDSEVKYMVDTVTNPEYFIANNKVGDEVWKNGDRTDTSEGVKMLTDKPSLDLEYTPEAGALRAPDGLVISPDDIPVAVAVAINGNDVTQYTTFVHQACEDEALNCQWENVKNADDLSNPAFLLHVKDVYADLTIKKTGASVNPDGTGLDAGQSFLFTVTGPEGYSTEVIIVGNGSVTLKNLKIGEYTVTENTSWSWRYTPKENNKKIILVANGTNTVTINNTRNEDKWLDGNVHKDNEFTGAAATTN